MSKVKTLLLLLITLALFAVVPQVARCEGETSTEPDVKSEAAATKLFFENKTVPGTNTSTREVTSKVLNKTPILDPKIALEVRKRSVEQNVDILLHEATRLKFLTAAVSQQAEENPFQLRGACGRDFRKELQETALIFTAACGGMIDESLLESGMFPALRDQTNQLQGEVSTIGKYIDSRKLAEQGDTGFEVIVRPSGSPGNIQQAFSLFLPNGTPVDNSVFTIVEGDSGGRQISPSVKLYVIGLSGPESYTLYGNKNTGGIGMEKTIRMFPLEPNLNTKGLGEAMRHHGIPLDIARAMLAPILVAAR